MSKAFNAIRKTGKMAPPSETTSIETPRTPLSQIKPKFFRRNVEIPFSIVNGNHEEYLLEQYDEDEAGLDQLAILPKLRVKKYYLRKILDEPLDYYDELTSASFYRKIPKQNTKCLTHFTVHAHLHKNARKLLKNASCLRNLRLLSVEGHDNVPKSCRLLSYAGKHVSTLNVRGVSLKIEGEHEVYKFYKTLSSFPSLKKFVRNITFAAPNENYRYGGTPKDYFELEQNLMHRYLEPYHNLKEVTFFDSDQKPIECKALGECFRKERPQKFPLITRIRIQLKQTMLKEGIDLTEISKSEPRPQIEQSFNQLLEFIKDDDKIEEEEKEEEEEEREEAKEGEKNNEELPPEGKREKLVQKFDFSVLPNLKCLNLDFPSNRLVSGEESCFIVGGFETIKSLKELNLKLEYRPHGTVFFFEELLNLPLLTQFSINILYIRAEEWDLLAKFLQKQHNLTSLRIEAFVLDTMDKTRYQNLCSSIGNALAALQNTPKLENLELNFSDSPFNKFAQECLSKGLEQASTTVKQLKSFTFSGILLPIDYGTPSWDHLEGFCKFIQQQKQTLTSLSIHLNYLVDAGAGIYLAKIIPELQELKVLKFHARTFDEEGGASGCFEDWILKFFQVDEYEEIPKIQNKTWNPLAKLFPKILPQLPKLEGLKIMLQRVPYDSAIEYEKSWDEKIYFPLLEMLPKLKSLKTLHIGIPVEVFNGKWKKKTFGVILGLKQVNTIKIDSIGQESNPDTDENYLKLLEKLEIEHAKKYPRREYQDKNRWHLGFYSD